MISMELLQLSTRPYNPAQSASLSLPTRAPGQVVDLTATQDSAAGSVMLEWVAPTHNPDQVTSYDVRFKTVDAAHYTYLKPVGMLRVWVCIHQCIIDHVQFAVNLFLANTIITVNFFLCRQRTGAPRHTGSERWPASTDPLQL